VKGVWEWSVTEWGLWGEFGFSVVCFAVGISEKPQLYDSEFGSLDRQNSRK
jgi:hypothetical protein